MADGKFCSEKENKEKETNFLSLYYTQKCNLPSVIPRDSLIFFFVKSE